MAAEHDTLLDIVVTRLKRGGVRFALIGAAAMALHGVSRSTLDIDLLPIAVSSTRRSSASTAAR